MLRARRRPTASGVRSRRGFTLVELAIAVILISVGLLGSAALMATSLRYQRGSTSRDEMLSLAEAKLDELNTYSRATVASGLRLRLAAGGSLTSSVTGYADSTTTVSGKAYRLRWRVDSLAHYSRNVQVRVQPKYNDPMAPTGLDVQTRLYIH